MDFSRTTQPQTVAPSTQASSTSAGNRKGRSGDGNWGGLSSMLLVGAVALLLIALVAFISFGGNKDKSDENKYVNSSKLQAVFLNTGQVYFGKIQSLTDKYFVVTNIYYLQTSSTGAATTAAAANTSVSLVKLGCELHEPLDQMVINRSQVTFWENLSPDGQVAKAVKTFQQQNPSGQKCADQTNASGSTPSNVQNAGTAKP